MYKQVINVKGSNRNPIKLIQLLLKNKYDMCRLLSFMVQEATQIDVTLEQIPQALN